MSFLSTMTVRRMGVPARRWLSSMRLNMNGAVRGEWKSKTLRELVDGPVTCLNGMGGWTPAHEEKFKLRSVGDLGAWRFFARARALVELATAEAEGERPESSMNVNKALDMEHEGKSLREIGALPPSALQGLTPAHDVLLRELNVVTVRDLGEWPAARYASAVSALAALETDDVAQHK